MFNKLPCNTENRLTRKVVKLELKRISIKKKGYCTLGEYLSGVF